MAKITKEIVEAVKKYEENYSMMTNEDMAILVGVSPSSVNNIRRGMCDYLLEEKEVEQTPIRSEIPYNEYKRLIACEMAINEMFKSAKSSTYEDDYLFIDYHDVSYILQKYVPDDYQNVVDELERNNRVCRYSEVDY